MREIEFETVKFAANELAKNVWFTIKVMLDSLTDEEIEKIPDVLTEDQRKAAERYGICDIINRDDKYTYIYWTGGYIFKGETKTITTNE
jgi:hypothetical protein